MRVARPEGCRYMLSEGFRFSWGDSGGGGFQAAVVQPVCLWLQGSGALCWKLPCLKHQINVPTLYQRLTDLAVYPVKAVCRISNLLPAKQWHQFSLI